MAHAVGVTVEGELGVLGSLETGEAGEEDGVGAEGKLTREQMLTDPEQAADFVAADRRATRSPSRSARATARTSSRKPPTGDDARDRPHPRDPRDACPNTHLVMHGSSSVPQEWLAIIREYGGEMKETYGVPVEEIREGIRNGVRKVNIDTDIRLAMTGAMRRAMAEDPSAFDPRAFLKAARAATTDLCASATRSSARRGGPSRIKPVPLEEMAEPLRQRADSAARTAMLFYGGCAPARTGARTHHHTRPV